MRALLSVYDKTGIVDLGRGLHDLGWELVSSSNTARALREAGLPVTEVADVTGVPEMLGHRVVTLHPNIHGGLLADLDNPEHVEDLERHGITPIGLDRVEPLSVRRASRRRDDRHRRPGDGARRGEEPRARRGRRRSRRLRRGARRAASRGCDLARDTAGARPQGVRAHVRVRRGDRGVARRRRRGCASRDAVRSRSTGCRSCATARTRTRPARATASEARGAGGTTRCSTAARSSRTSTSSTPRPRGGSCTSSVTVPPR